MGERKGQNKYYPPDFDPKKHKSLDAYHGTHALRERASKLHMGILVIRFEMPYNIWCEGCKNPIGMGVRYNAEKSKIGMYYSTPIYNFHMKCHLCDQYFDIKTDPASHDYVITSGARRKEQRWDPKENEQIVTEDKNDQKKLATDAMYKIEHGVDDKTRSKKAHPGISQITASRHQWKDDYYLNKLARNDFRVKKKSLKKETETDQALLAKSSLEIELLPEHADDKKMAELLQYRTVASFDEKQQQRREEINNRSIFESSKVSSPLSTPSSSSTGSDSSVGTPSRSHLKLSTAHSKIAQIVGKRRNPFSLHDGKDKVMKNAVSSKCVGIVRKSNKYKLQGTDEEEKFHPSKEDDVDNSEDKNNIISDGEQEKCEGQSEKVCPRKNIDTSCAEIEDHTIASSQRTGSKADSTHLADSHKSQHNLVDEQVAPSQSSSTSKLNGLINLMSNYSNSNSDSD